MRPARRLARGAAFAVPGPAMLPQLLLTLFVLTDVGQALTMDWAEKRSWKERSASRQYARQTVLVATSSISIISSLVAAWSLGGMTAFCECFDQGLFFKFLPVSLFFTIGLSLKMMAVDHFQAGTIKIIGQLRLPALALFSTALFHRKYTAVQWQVIGMVTTSCMSFVLLKGQERNREGKSWKWVGLSQLLGWILLNTMGGITAEHVYKSNGRPYYAQKVAEDFGHLLVGLVMLVLVSRQQPGENIWDRKQRPGGFFDSWDVSTWAVVLFLFLDAWVGNRLVKEFSGVTRSIAKAFAISGVYFVSLTYAKDRMRNPALTFVALLVIQSSLLFAFTR